MESGYTRKKRRDRRRAVVIKQPPGQLPNTPLPRKRGKSVATITRELEATRNQMKRKGVKFAVEHMDDAIDFIRGAMALKQPWLPDGTERKGGDVELFFRLIGLLRDFTNARAPYQTPRLSAVAVVPQPASKAEQQTTMTVNIFNQRGEQVDDAKVLTLHAVSEDNKDEDAA